MKINNTLKKNTWFRVIVALLMFCCVMWGFWWLTWCLAIALLFYFPFYLEIVAWGIIYDALYGIPLPEFWNINHIFTIVSITLFLISFIIKRILIAYES